MSIELRANSPRCFVCGELTSNKAQHFKDNHAELFVYHMLVQMPTIIKNIGEPLLIFDDIGELKHYKPNK